MTHDEFDGPAHSRIVALGSDAVSPRTINGMIARVPAPAESNVRRARPMHRDEVYCWQSPASCHCNPTASARRQTGDLTRIQRPGVKPRREFALLDFRAILLYDSDNPIAPTDLRDYREVSGVGFARGGAKDRLYVLTNPRFDSPATRVSDGYDRARLPEAVMLAIESCGGQWSFGRQPARITDHQTM